MTTTTPTGTTVGHVLIFSGQPRFTIPLLTIPALTGSGLDGFTLGLNYLTGFDGFTSSDGTVGLHFNYTQNATLTASGLDVILQNGDNTQVVFTSTDGIHYSSVGNNSSAILRRYNAGAYSETFNLTGAGGVVTVFSGIGSAVDIPGRPQSLSDRYGNTQTFNWAAASPARLQSVTDSYGRTTAFSYGGGPAYQMQEVTDFQGRKVNFQYDGSGRLIAIVLPSINSGANGNTFPNGTGYVFEYDTGNPRSDRQNDLIAIYYPNQVNAFINSTRTVNVSGVYSTATARRQFAYFQDPTDPFTYGKVQQVTESASGAGSIGSGAWGFLYSDTGLPANLLNPYDFVVSTAVVTDRNNNVTSFDFNAAGMTVCMVASSRGKSSLEPGPWTTWMAYNAHNQLTLQVNPAGDSVAYAYEDESNTVTIDGQPYPLRVGLLQSVTRYAGNSFGIPSRPGSGGQTQLTTLYFHDLYSQTAATIEPRGNPIDSSNNFFPPQNLGATPTLADRTRYATVNYFNYQKDALPTLRADSNLIAALGLTSPGDLTTLVDFIRGQMSAVGLSFPMGIGDVNGQGTGAGSSGGPARHDGAPVMTTRPSVSQLIPNGQGAYPQTVLFDSPAAYWRLGETSGTTAADSSGNGYSGTYSGGYTLGEPGALADDSNASVLVNGSTGCVDFGAVSPISGGDFTVEAWINISSFVEAVPGNYVSYAVAKGADYLYDVGGNTTNAYGLAIGGGSDGSGHASADAAIYFMCGMPNPTYNSYLTWITDLTLGQWYHVVGVKQGATMSLYVNGQLQASQAYSGSINADATLEMLVGKTQRGSPYTYAFDGKVDEVALYDTALSAERILAHYNAGTGADAWVWQTQSVYELYTHNKKGQRTTVTNAEGNLTLYVRYPENNPDGTGTYDDPSLSTQQYGRIKKVIVDADPSTVMTAIGSYGDMITFIGNLIPRTNTPGTYQSLTTTHQGASGCTTCNWDPLGNVLTAVDARGNLTQFDRNELGEVYRVTSPAPYSFLVETTYDANRNVIQVDTQDWVVEYSSSSPSSPLYAQFTPSGSGSTADVPMTAGPGGTTRSGGWFSNVYTFDLLDNKTEDDIDATGSSPSSLVTGYTFDYNQNLIKITKPLTNTVEFDFDERDLRIATRVGGSSGPVTVYINDLNGNLQQVIGPATRGTAAQTLSCTIGDAFNGGSGVLYSGDWAAYNVFDGFDRLLTSTDPAGGMLLNTYDPGGRVIATQTLGSPGGPTPSDRSGSGNVTLASDAARFDELGRQYETQRDVFLDGGIYYGGGPLLGLPSGRTVTHTGGGLAANSTTNNHTATVTLTAGGTSYVLSRRVFDRLGRVTASATDNGAVSTTAFDGADRAITQTDALNNVVSYTFDGNSNVTALTRTVACTISGTIPTESFGALMCYDVMNRLVIQASQGADGTLTNYFPTPGSATIYTLMGYDSRGNRTNIIDPKLNTTVFDLDGASRLLQTDQHLRTGGVGTNAITATVSTYQTFDANSNLSKLTDSNGGVTWFYYDTLDRQTSLVFYDGSTRVYGYDLASDITGYTDENGSSFTSTFDALGRKTAAAITLAAGVVGTTAQSFQFDGLSRMTFARDSVSGTNADTGFTFDSISRVLEEQQTYSGDTRYVTHNAWTSYRATGFTFPSSRQTTTGFDALYRMNAITETSDSSSIAAWNFFGDRVATVALGNGLACSFMNNAQTRSAIQSGQTTPGWGSITTDQLGYDGAGRLIGKRYFNGSSVLVGFTTAYDLSSNKLFERPLHAESRAALYDSYDSMNRLLDYQRGTLNSGGGSLSGYIALPGTNQEQAYNLDSLGNWSTTTITSEGGSAAVQNRTHNLLNQVTAFGVSPTSTPVYYDQGNNSGTPPQKGNGNIINDGTRINAFDALNRLVTVKRVSDGLQIGGYVYDAVGRRIVRAISNGGVNNVTPFPNGTSRYLLDGQRIVEELSGTLGSAAVQYVWSPCSWCISSNRVRCDTRHVRPFPGRRPWGSVHWSGRWFRRSILASCRHRRQGPHRAGLRRSAARTLGRVNSVG